MAIDFPASPTNGQTHTVGSTTWTWDGTKWEISSAGGGGATDNITEGNTTAEVVDTGSDGHFKVTTEGTERLRVTPAGLVGVGTTSPNTTLDVSKASNNLGLTEIMRLGGTAAASNDGWKLSFYQTAVNEHGYLGCYYVSGSTWNVALNSSHNIELRTGGTERMRITSAGHVGIGVTPTYRFDVAASAANSYIGFHQNTANTADDNVYLFRMGANANSASATFLYCQTSTTQRISLRGNGGIANYQSNNINLSDRNAKKNISLAANTWNCVKEWEIVNYRYKDQPDDADLNLGVIAQQVAESCPEVITVFQEATEDQPEKLGVKEQQMYWMAIKALQEAQVRIETLETTNASQAATIAAIEARLIALEGGN